MLANHPNMLGRGPTASSLGIGDVDGPSSATDNALARFDGTTGKIIQNGVVTEADYTGTLTGATDQATTTAVGLGFANQPANDGVELVSSSASDTQTATVIGTTNGVDTVAVEAVVLTGTSVVATVKTDWGIILAIKLSSAAVGTITVREASADQTITTLAPAATSKGVTTVTNTAAYNRTISMVADAATTKQLGFGGTDTSGTQIYDSQALTGTTAAVTNSSFYTVTEVYRGDLEAARTATITTDGTWNLTGGGGGILAFNTAGAITLTAGGTNQNITLTPSGTGKVAITAAQDTTNGMVTIIPTGGDASMLSFLNRSSGASVSSRRWALGINYNVAGDFELLRSTSSTGGPSTSVLMVTADGNFVLGSTVDSGALLQIGTNTTTSAGGLVFGTDTFLYRRGTGILTFGGAASSSQLELNDGTSRRSYWAWDGSNVTLAAAFNPLILVSNGTTALTLDSSQNATFAGVAKIKDYLVSGLPSAATYAYALAFVRDATLTAITGLGLAVVGGGGNKVPVYSDGTNWIIL